MKSLSHIFLFYFSVALIITISSCIKKPNVNPSGPPTITGVSNFIAGIGYTVIVTGTNFSSAAANNTVTINNIPMTVISAASTQLSFFSTNAVSGTLSISVNGKVTTFPTSIRIISLTTSTLAGSGSPGSDDGMGTAATFNQPWSCAYGPDGYLYVADSYNNKIRKIKIDGTVSTVAGTGAKGNTDGAGAITTFDTPYGIAVDNSGNIFVSDIGTDNIRKITPGGTVSTFAGSPTGRIGSNDGNDTTASFHNPLGLVTDANGNVYVADGGNNSIRKITAAGVVSTIAGTGFAGAANGSASTATFNAPLCLAIDGSGNLYVTEMNNYDIRKIDAGGNVTTIAGTGQAGSSDGQGTSAAFNFPVGIVSDGQGNLFVTDNGYGTIRMITSTGFVATVAGNGIGTSTDGVGIGSGFSNPLGMAIDPNGNLYVCDNASNKIRKVVIQ